MPQARRRLNRTAQAARAEASPSRRRSSSSRTAREAVVAGVGWIVATELLILVAGTILAVAALRRWGPGRLKGMASAAEAEASLGRTRLRRVRQIIRPDLYPARTNRRQPATDPKESS